MPTIDDVSATRPGGGFRLGVSRKLAFGISAIFAVFAVTGVVTLTTCLDLASISKQTSDSAAALSLTGYLNNFGARQKYISYDFLLTQTPADLKNYADAREGFDKARRDLQNLYSADDPTLLPYLKAYGDLHDEWQIKVGDEALRLGADNAAIDRGRALLRGEVSQGLSDRSRIAGSALGKATQQWADRWTEAHGRQLDFLRMVILSGIVVGLALAVCIGWLLAKSLVHPLISMTAAMKQLATGDHDIAIPAVGRQDEIGDMAGAVQVFKDAAVEKVRLEREAAEQQRRLAEAERARQQSGEAEAERLQRFALQALASGLSHLSQGDLTYRLDVAFGARYESLRADFNGAMSTLRETIEAVAANTSAIVSGTGEISSASDDLSRRTEQQAASLEETAAALDEITATVRRTAEGSKHARDVVGHAKQAAEQSGQVVHQAVEAMSGIEKSAGQIGNIIGVIDEIAFQTNLLALNAGVEAARAGEAGRGFAVVASEVRALAQRSADAAKEIKTLISASSAQVAQGVSLVGRTGQALELIVAQVAEINGIVSDIAASAQEQATGLDQVNTAVNQMDQVTQQNAAMVEQTTAASHALARETEDLTRLIRQFQVGEDRAHGPVGARQNAKPSVQAIKRPASATVMKVPGQGGAARRVEPQESSWQEF